MTQHDRIWSDFNLEKNCVHFTAETQVRLYLAQMTLALKSLGRVIQRSAGADNLEARAIDRHVSRLESTFRLLALKHFYPSADLPLKIDTTDSGFFHFSTLIDLAADLKARDALLAVMHPVDELKREMAARIVHSQAPVRDLQQQIARRLYLEALSPEGVLEPFVPGQLVQLQGDDAQHMGFWSFATYDKGLNRPFVYLVYFVYDRKHALQEGSEDHQKLIEASARLASGTSTLLGFSNQLDDLSPIHPRIVKRVILGPYWAPGYTENEGELGQLLEGNRSAMPFALRWETETLLSDRELRIGRGLLSKGRLKQVFWIPRDFDLSQRGVSRLERSILVPHWLGQQMADASLLADHARYVIDKEDEVYGVH